jgi:hypothetical protein
LGKFNIFIIYIFLLIFTTLPAQLPIKRDDFRGTSRKLWWQYDREGSAELATVVNGILRLRIPYTNGNIPWCNTSLWDGYNMYYDVTLTVRARATTPARPGSRGWGLWYTNPLGQPSEQAWFMQVGDCDTCGYDPPYDPANVWWRISAANMYWWPNPWIEEYDIEENIQEWHTYKIVRDYDPSPGNPEFIFYIDGVEVFRSTFVTITENPNLSVQIWNDNLIYPRDPVPTYVRREWNDDAPNEHPDETVLDYVEVLTAPHPGTSVAPSGLMLLREIPFEVGPGQTDYLWKNYNFTAPGGKCAIMVTARAEQYGSYGDDDDVKINIGGHDYGWNSPKAFNGDILNGNSKTVVIDTVLNPGQHNIEIYGDQSPILYDVTVIGSSNGGIILNETVEERPPFGSGDNYPWKTYDFLCHEGEVYIYVSGSAAEDLSPSSFGRFYADFDNSQDEDIRIVLDGNNYGWQNDNAIWGNRLFGESKSILVHEYLSRGSHTLQIYSNNRPRLHSVVIYGENDDVALPVTLNFFNVEAQVNKNVIKWKTESELNNFGFNLYKAQSVTDKRIEELNFTPLNHEIIPGAGSSTQPHTYLFEDEDVSNGQYYWYQLEDVDFNGVTKKHDIRKIYRNENLAQNFMIYQNYPNPFNQGTIIEYELPSQLNAEISIYNVSGQRIYLQNLGLKPAGKYQFYWDGRDNLNNHLSSGVYYYRIKTEVGSKIKSLLLLK